MKRILVFSSEFPPGPGGIGTHAWQLARHLAGSGWDVGVLTSQDYADDVEMRIFNASLSFPLYRLVRYRVWWRSLFARFLQLRRLIQARQPDLLIVTGDWLVLLVALARCLNWVPARLKWVAIWHGVVPPQMIKKHLAAWAFSQPDLTIAVSQYSQSQMLNMGVHPRASKVILNGADHLSYYPEPSLDKVFRAKLGLSNVDKILLTVGNMSERKGQDIVIRALPEVLRTCPFTHYIIAGLPTIQTELQHLADNGQIRDRVHFLGRLSADDLLAAYNACDIFILTSRHSKDGQFEGYGIVAAEAALCARPAVVAGNSGLSEAVQHGVTGLVVPENDPVATARAIQSILENPSLWRQMGQAARQRAITTQTWDATFKEYEASFRVLLNYQRAK